MYFELAFNLFLLTLFFFFIRANLKQLLKNLNCQKIVIKTHGIVVDDKKYNISFTGITL